MTSVAMRWPPIASTRSLPGCAVLLALGALLLHRPDLLMFA
jgi:hypothetical protein